MATHSHSRHQGVVLAPPAEDLCLAFANTRFWRGRETPTETLADFGDIVDWLGKNAGLPPGMLKQAQQWAGDHRAGAANDVIEIRETIYRLFAGVASDDAPGERDLTTLNRALAGTPARQRLSRGERGFGWAAEAVAPTVPTLLAPVLWSAADLLIYAGNRRLRRCANDECLWLFMDHSKGGTRRWCDMNSCGNRAKARRHYLKHKGE